MEEIKKRFFMWNDIDVDALFDAMSKQPVEAKWFLEKTIKLAWFLMKRESIEHKYRHKIRELYDEYDMDFDLDI